MTPEYRKAYLTYHLCVFLWGFTAVFGKIIHLNAIVLVWYRMGLTTLILAFFPGLISRLRRMDRKTILQLTGIGVLVTCHWITFYGSVKEANISVTLTCLATTSFFVSIVEPVILRTKFIWYELLLGLIVIPAIYLIFHFSGDYTYGIILGLLSTFFATLFSVLNKKMVQRADPSCITFTEIGAGFILLSLVVPLFLQAEPDVNLVPSYLDVLNLILFAAFCTVVPFTLSLRSMKHLSVFTASITLNLEPVYGIIMAIVFFNEDATLSTGFYIGSCMILAVVFINPFIQQKFGALGKKPLNIGE